MSSNAVSSQENIHGILQDKSNVGVPQSKLLDKNTKNERIAFKEINPNINRIQPFRAAKQVMSVYFRSITQFPAK